MSETIETAPVTLSDVADAVKIIDYAADQGAFRGWTNIRQILAVRDRLEAFISTFSAAQEVNSTEPSALTDEA